MVKNLPEIQETWVQSLGREDPLEKEMATHSSIHAWRIPWTEEPHGLQSMASQKVGHDWGANTHTHIHTHTHLWMSSGEWRGIGPIGVENLRIISVKEQTRGSRGRRYFGDLLLALVFFAALSSIAGTWKKPKCPSTEEYIKKMWYRYTVEYYSVIERNETVPFTETWIDLETRIIRMK